jgi:hypothetical protein
MLALSGAAIGAQAQDSKVDVGVLTCQVEGGSGFIFGSSKNLTCEFEMASGKVESYSGQINKFGLDIGFTNATTISWGVLAPNTTLGDDTLAGNYVGASAEASAGVGGGANVLIGGSQESISLQPLSVQGQTGLNAALGVAELILNPA